MEQQAFGGIEREPSPSDFHLGAFNSPTYPTTFLPAYNLTIESQKQIPDCGANAGVYLKEILHNDGQRLSVEYLWDKIKLIDGFPPEQGTDMLSIMKTLQKNGVCQFSLLPTDSTETLPDFTSPSKLTSTMDSDALQRRIGAYAFQFSPTFEEIKQAIYTHKVVLILFQVGQEFWTTKDGTPSWDGKLILPLWPGFPITSGHFMVADSYDENFIYGYNEWSDQWGNSGRYYFGKDYLPRVSEIGTAVDSSTYQFTKTLKIGMSGTEVGMLQKKLRDLGFFPDSQSITSFFGKITQQAVKDFQKNNNLVADGIVGTLTNKLLNTL